MRIFAILVGLSAATVMVDYAAAASCSAQRDVCLRNQTGRSTKAGPVSGCHVAHSECLKTGVWDSSMMSIYGVRRTGLAKR